MVVGNVPSAADFVVIGAGPGGYTAALAAAKAGRKVTLIDSDGAAGAGGACLRVGCIPSKALIEAAELDHKARNAEAMGVASSRGEFDMRRFQAWKSTVINGLTDGVRSLLASANVNIVAGVASFTEPNVVIVASADGQAQFIQFKDAIVATGSRPTALPALPFNGDTVIDSTGALALDEVPSSVAVVGGGYIGVEIGTALAKLGAVVTLVEAQDQILPGMDETLSRPVAKSLEALGVSVYLRTRAASFNEKQLELESISGTRQTIAAERVIVATGREAAIATLGLETIGITPDENGRLSVAPDRRLQRHIAAIGDVTPGPALAHKASAEAEVAVAALNGQTVAFEPAAIPAIVFCDPEVATAGLSAVQARAEGIDVNTTRVPFSASGRALTLSKTAGFCEVVSDRADGSVLGVHIVGPHASELVSEAVLAIELGATVEDIALTVHPHPTLSEQLWETAKRAL